MKIIVEGKIKGKARPRFNTKTGRAFTPSDTISYENWIKHCYIEQAHSFLQGEIVADVKIYYAIPKSYSKKRIEGIKQGIEKPVKKPDIDNILKILFDSLNEVAYKDDAQIIEVHVYKEYTLENERIEFELTERKRELK